MFSFILFKNRCSEPNLAVSSLFMAFFDGECRLTVVFMFESTHRKNIYFVYFSILGAMMCENLLDLHNTFACFTNIRWRWRGVNHYSTLFLDTWRKTSTWQCNRRRSGNCENWNSLSARRRRQRRQKFGRCLFTLMKFSSYSPGFCGLSFVETLVVAIEVDNESH